MNAFFRKLRWILQRRDKEAELREELRFHLEQEAEERNASGVAHDEARWAARRDLGNVSLVAENTRAAWGWPVLEQFARDARHGMRELRRNPTVSSIAIATLALGMSPPCSAPSMRCSSARCRITTRTGSS
jgi:macrolide transport system ATP-binding/permease protein